MANFRSRAIVLTLGQPIGAIAGANPTISQHPWVLAATTTASAYNDDIQGTGGVRLADLTVAGMGEQSVTPEAERQQIRMFDTQGTGVAGRPGLAAHKLPYSRKLSPANPSHDEGLVKGSLYGDI
jgi:hypothetical protein